MSAFDRETLDAVEELFESFTTEFVELEPTEAELAKLMTNAWRYVQFAPVNQFYMIARHNGLDFDRILHACRHNYPRMVGMPGPGFAAGPCLMKDTMQLAAFSRNNFVLGHAAFEHAAVPLLYDKLEGMIGDLLAAPLSPLELLAGYVLSALVNGLMVGALVLGLAFVFVDQQ